MSIILDVSIVLIIALSVLICFIKGFAKSLFSSFGLLGAILVAIILIAPIGAIINNAFVYEDTYEMVKETVTDIEAGDSVSAWAEKFEEKNPKTVALLKALGFDINGIIEEADNKTDLASDEMVTKIATPIAKLISNVYAFLISVVALYIVFFILSRVFDLAAKSSKLGATNKALGAVYGLVLGILRASVIAIAVSGVYPIIAGLVSEDPAVINAVSNSYIFNFFVKHNIIVWLMTTIF